MTSKKKAAKLAVRPKMDLPLIHYLKMKGISEANIAKLFGRQTAAITHALKFTNEAERLANLKYAISASINKYKGQ